MSSGIFDVVEATWPPAGKTTLGPWTLRDGQGGGSRVSATTVNGPFTGEDIDRAEAAMREMGQDLLFMIRPMDTALDSALAARGYVVKDPVNVYECPISQLTDQPLPRVRVFALWEPLAIMQELWQAGGIGPARLAVMHRVKGPKTGLLGRQNDKPGGVAFAAIHDGTCMVHAVEIPPHQRRQGMAGWMMRGAAFWAAEHGAERMAVLCTKSNIGANALYSSLGMTPVGEYHYRHKPDEESNP